MREQNKSQAFTLVELIVVITILAILGTIAFVSLQSYTKNARDSQRISDINNIKKGLELFVIEKGFYPEPDNQISITYSGSVAWNQGTIGDNATKNIQKLNTKPTDPLTQNEYTYSVTGLKTEYQIGSIYEGGSLLGLNNALLINKAHAATEQKALAMVSGTYNEKFLKVQSGTTDFVLAVPSIINSDVNDTDLLNIITKKQLVFNNYTNIPDSYKGKGYSMTGGFDFTPSSNIVVYSGSVSDLSQDSNKLVFIGNLKQVYTATIIQSDVTYKDIIDTDINTNSAGAIVLVNNYLNNNIGGVTATVVTSTNEQTLTTYTAGCNSPDITIGSYTVAGCNVGTTISGTGSDSYGSHFQWGNNNGFPSSGTVITSPTQVDASTYGPGNYYDVNAFITGAPFPYDWSSIKNDNLWGDTDNSSTARQGPCSNGYHVPSQTEWQGLVSAGDGIYWNIAGTTTEGRDMMNYLKLPMAGYRYYNDGLFSQGISGSYWTSSINLNNAVRLYLSNTTITVPSYQPRSNGYSIRCFKN